MSDKEKLVALLESFGLERSEKEIDDYRFPCDGYSVRERDYGHGVGIGTGSGYNGFYCEFMFDKDGKYMGHGCWE